MSTHHIPSSTMSSKTLIEHINIPETVSQKLLISSIITSLAVLCLSSACVAKLINVKFIPFFGKTLSEFYGNIHLIQSIAVSATGLFLSFDKFLDIKELSSQNPNHPTSIALSIRRKTNKILLHMLVAALALAVFSFCSLGMISKRFFSFHIIPFVGPALSGYYRNIFMASTLYHSHLIFCLAIAKTTELQKTLKINSSIQS
ncbi:MAG: hypothetical protein ACOVOR_01875 [Rhabdochlamydiaceae bacterium]